MPLLWRPDNDEQEQKKRAEKENPAAEKTRAFLARGVGQVWTRQTQQNRTENHEDEGKSTCDNI
jgi:hypothetical protein